VLTAARQFAAVGLGDTLIGTPFGDMRTVARRVVSVHRVGYRPASWDWTPWEYAGADGRFRADGRSGLMVVALFHAVATTPSARPTWELMTKYHSEL
jgi:hypothetical protein